jgi:adenylosuccinate synthase
MSVSVVVGSQFGSEGKGKTASLLARDYGEECVVVRCGGPNSGHIVCEHQREYRFRHVPAGLVYRRYGYIAPAAVIDLEVLRREVSEYKIPPTLLGIDPFSVVITDAHRQRETMLKASISSTGSGTGAAMAEKMMREPSTLLVKDVLKDNSWLEPYVRDVNGELNALADRGTRIIVEGTQGFGLSLHHSDRYPHTTSKDTSAAQFIMEAGLSPLLVDEVIMVIRTFPIRVSGEQAGELPQEVTWGEIQRASGCPHELGEFTTVTRKLRRVGRFDWPIVLKACQVNRPTKLVVHGLDYLDYANRGVHKYSALTEKAKAFVSDLEKQTQVPVLYAFTGRDNSDLVRLLEPPVVQAMTEPTWRVA